MAIAVVKMGDDTFSDKNGLVERYNDDNAIALIKALESLAIAADNVGMKAVVEPICNARSNVASWAATQDFSRAVIVDKEEARRGTNMLLLFDMLLDYILREGRSSY